MMFVCTRCKRDVDVGGNFCPFCGAVAPPPAEHQADPLIGQTIANKYFINQPVGSGGMGSVYKATDLVLDRPVALKMLSKTLATDPQMVQRFHREARASSKLNHPNAITVLDFGQAADGTLFLAMEFLSGRSLSDIIQKDFPVAQGRVVRIVAQILSALADAHALGIIHRDLKPSNVMVETRRDEPDFVKVLDFGIAKINEPGDGRGRLTSVGMVCGTPGYMSPEQARGDELDVRSDLYAVGVILYELVTGKLPFEDATPMAIITRQMMEVPPSPRERRPDLQISVELDALVCRAMAREREERPPSAEQFRNELLACDVPIELGARNTPPPARSATMVLPAADSVGTPATGTPKKPASGPSPVFVDPQFLGAAPVAQTPAGQPAKASPARGVPTPSGRGATPSPARPQTPAPRTEPDNEGDDEIAASPRDRRATPAPKRPSRAPRGSGPGSNRGLFIGIGLGVVVLGAGLFFLLTSDPFEVPEAPAPTAMADLSLTTPTGPKSETPSGPATPPVDAPPATPPAVDDESPPAVAETEATAGGEDDLEVEQTSGTESGTGQPDPVPRPPKVAKGSGVLQIAPGIKGMKVPSRSSGEGLIVVNASPWAILSVDGKEIGETPRQLRVGAGYYWVTLAHPSFGERKRKVTVRPGRRATVNVSMAR